MDRSIADDEVTEVTGTVDAVRSGIQPRIRDVIGLPWISLAFPPHWVTAMAPAQAGEHRLQQPIKETLKSRCPGHVAYGRRRWSCLNGVDGLNRIYWRSGHSGLRTKQAPFVRHREYWGRQHAQRPVLRCVNRAGSRRVPSSAKALRAVSAGR